MELVVMFNPFKNEYVVLKEGKRTDGTIIRHKVKDGFNSKDEAWKYADEYKVNNY